MLNPKLEWLTQIEILIINFVLMTKIKHTRIWFSVFSFITWNFKVSQFVGSSVIITGNDVDIISDHDSSQVFLGQVLEVSLGERSFGSNRNFVTIFFYRDSVSELSFFAINLDGWSQEIGEFTELKDLILKWDTAVDSEVKNFFVFLLGFSFLKDISHC